MSKTTEHESRQIRFSNSWAIRVGLLLLVLGTGPLFAMILAGGLGWTSNSNPNPIWPGLLAGLTFLPGVILITAGVAKVTARRERT